ncbi:MAG: hypothetical protein N3F07_01450 [Candidatus Micrarchaeota archaeon]|nr:hypothetical protein [Candidatus Micrarchaeota archaeon]
MKNCPEIAQPFLSRHLPPGKMRLKLGIRVKSPLHRKSESHFSSSA